MDAMKPSDAAEARVARYLTERGYSFEVEPDLGIIKRPDFLITTDRTVVVEVKAFETYGMFENPVLNQPMARSLTDALKPIRKQIEAAAKQLKPLQDRGWPLVVMLANPGRRPIPFTSSMIFSAMYGDLEMQAPMLSDGSLGEFRGAAGLNGKLRNHHAYISAVAVARRRDHSAQWAAEWCDAHEAEFGDDVTGLVAALAEAHQDAPEGDEVFLEVFETLSSTAVPLPRDIFNGPGDLHWVPNADRTALTPWLTTEPR
ncbi:nuclease-related domain-containing protein [Streptomyces sp. NPDC052236]|uniref:nuclease-related domain-containing protein n=1 Tax=Streptomyces sp. NPDC052236 TaxID=3365686 RepID=UPI0037D3466E